MNEFLAKERIGKLMVTFSVPCIMSLLVSSLYNIVDQIFIGQGIGYLGNGATNVVFPVTIIALAIALMIGDGSAAYLSICQGKKDQDSSHKTVGNAIAIVLVLSIVLTAILFIFSEQFLQLFGATTNNIGYAREYYQYILIGLPAFMFGNAMNSIIRSDGNPRFAMFSTLLGAIINVIFDPLLIFVFDMGMAGAALATVGGQVVTALLAILYLWKPKSFQLTGQSFKLRIATLKNFMPLGISSFLTQISIVLIMAVMNNVLVQYGAQSKYGADIPLTVVGIVMKVFQIVISVVVGIAAGIQPIVGYNYGAKNYGRVLSLFKRMLLVEAIIGGIALLAFEIFPMQIIAIFGSEDGLYNEFAVYAFRIYLASIVLCCIQKSVSIFLQSLGKSMLSMLLSLLRDVVAIIPLVILLPQQFGVIGALYSAPIADLISTCLVVYCVYYIYKLLTVDKVATTIVVPA